MGLSIGVVSTNYLDVPKYPIDAFFRELKFGPISWPDDYDGDEYCWGGGWDSNGLYEFTRESLEGQAKTWAKQQRITPAERKRLLRWVAKLPYTDDYVMFHIGE